MASVSVKPFFWMMVGVLTSVSLIIVIDVQIILSKIDFNDVESTPNIAPQILYYFIPIIFLPVALFSILANYLVLKFKKPPLVKTKPFYLGLSYGLIISFSIFINLEFPVVLSFILSVILTFLSVHVVSEKLIEKAL